VIDPKKVFFSNYASSRGTSMQLILYHLKKQLEKIARQHGTPSQDLATE
jgi:hypothetical protein